ncbi:MAG: hypothetical protein LBR65_03360 [Culturomica sp.]|jgi:hypothetical protein|nr:hypothetical protein [Culturomica sp.]
MVWLLTGIAGLLVTVALFTFLSRKKRAGSEPAPVPVPVPVPVPEKDCCGAHAICEKGLKKAGETILYYEDEELDLYRNTRPDQYLPEQIDLFREVLYTLKREEISGWLISLEQRGISLPDLLRPEAFDLLQNRE